MSMPIGVSSKREQSSLRNISKLHRSQRNIKHHPSSKIATRIINYIDCVGNHKFLSDLVNVTEILIEWLDIWCPFTNSWHGILSWLIGSSVLPREWSIWLIIIKQVSKGRARVRACYVSVFMCLHSVSIVQYYISCSPRTVVREEKSLRASETHWPFE